MTFSNFWSSLTPFCHLILSAATTGECMTLAAFKEASRVVFLFAKPDILESPLFSLEVFSFFHVMWASCVPMDPAHLASSWKFICPYGTSCHLPVLVSQPPSPALTVAASKFNQPEVVLTWCATMASTSAWPSRTVRNATDQWSHCIPSQRCFHWRKEICRVVVLCQTPLSP